MIQREDVERLVRIEEGIVALLARGTDHEKRLRAVEKKMWWQTGAAAVISAVAVKIGLPHLNIG